MKGGVDKGGAIKDFYENDELIAITKELTETLRKNRTLDWQKRESDRAKMRMLIKKLLKKHKYPPAGMEDAVQPVITQCELWTDCAYFDRAEEKILTIKEVKSNKKQYLDLLLLADEQEGMIDLYLERGKMFLLEDEEARAEIVVTDEGSGILEIKNLAVMPDFQRKGYGMILIDFIKAKHKGKFSVLRVGTGESPLTLPFYKRCGFVESGRIKNFFAENYDHPIFEGGVRLKDMIILDFALN